MIPAILAAALLLLSACTSRPSEPAPAPGRPNIVFIMADDLGYGHLGSYGQTRIQTPRLDRMAEEGTRFTQFYSGHNVCAPSRSVLMTGYHTGHTSVRINGGGSSLLPEDVTVGEVLKQAGYATGVFGKWGLGDAGTEGVPTKQGFDQFYGYFHQVHAHFYYPAFLWRNEEKHVLLENHGGAHEKYSHDLIVEESLKFIREHRDRPFFLYLPWTIPHFELLVPEDSRQQYEGKFPEPYPYVADHYASQKEPRTTLAAMITRLDRDVGRVLDLLGELGLDENTIVFFTSDNGGYLLDRENYFQANGPLLGSKGNFYEGGIRVPLIVRWPGQVAPGATDDFKWAFWDVLPTLASLGGAQTPQGIDGISVAQRVLGQGQEEPDRFLYWEAIPGLLGGDVQPRSVAVRYGKWKAIRPRADRPIELYDLEADIGEQNNVAEQHPEVMEEIRKFLATARTTPRTYPRQEPNWDYPRLKTGYVR